MKRILALIFVLCFVLALSACGEKEDKPAGNDTSAPASQVESTPDASTPDISRPEIPNPDLTLTDSQPSNGTEHTHAWSDWNCKIPAYIDKAGSEERTCSTCGDTETRERTTNAIYNSFYDGTLELIIMNDYGKLSGGSLLEYACEKFPEYLDKAVPASTIFAALNKRFILTDELKDNMRLRGENQFGYDKANDTFVLHNYGAVKTKFDLLGYIHNSGNQYTTYYAYSPFEGVTVYFAVKLEYNRTNNKPNRYLSIEKVDYTSLSMIKCANNEQIEVNS